MSGRGCTITINLISGLSRAQQQQQSQDGIFNSGSNAGNSAKVKVDDCVLDTIVLPVALHTPLSILKEQLVTQTGIYRDAQVLILLDITDPERNRDQLLSGRDAYSLRDCGIKNGSVLTLHALGLQFEREILLEGVARSSRLDSSVSTLSTPIMPSQANHSYSGVIFDIECSAPYECDIISLGVGGMLGRVRIFVRDRPWEADKPQERPSTSHYWATEGKVSKVGWSLVADLRCKACWDSTREIFFDKPVTMLPGTRRGFYVHSHLPDDLGIQYQSYGRDQLVASDSVLKVWPGLGHACNGARGAEPFDEVNGWYREHRSHAGDIHYRSRLKGWNIPQHRLFPAELRRSVRSLLLCHAVSAHPQQGIPPSSSEKVAIPLQGTLSRLPTFLIYNILEFMHWDWFVELREVQAEGEEEEGALPGHISAMISEIRQFILGNPDLANIAATTDGGVDSLVRYFMQQQGVVAEYGHEDDSEFQEEENEDYDEDYDDDDVEEESEDT